MKVDSLPWKVKYWFLDKWYYITNPFYRIYRILSWIPILWDNYDWDWTRIFAVLEFKLRRTEKCLRAGHHLHRDRDANQVLEVAILCKRMRGDYFDYNNEDKFIPHLKPWLLNNGEFNSCKYEDYMFNQDLERFCLLLRKYVRNWWD
jgi:hypothetical protein